ncbi:MAG: J domain-containing protein, partial [Candidatus Caldarchaeum sp.]
MSLVRRAYNLLRAHLHREWERVEGLFERSAREELEGYLSKQVEDIPEKESVPAVSLGEKMTDELAYQILNLPWTAGVDDLQRAYLRMSERTLPANFPEGSEERKKAVLLHVRVQEAYEHL